MIITSAQLEMIEKLDHLAEIIGKTLNNDATIEETALLQEWLDSNPENDAWLTAFMAEGRIYEELKVLNNIDTQAGLEKVQAKIKSARVIKIWKKIGVAVAITGLVCGTVWVSKVWNRPHATLAKKEKIIRPVQVPPGTNAAILTLADGSEIMLDSTRQGMISNEAGTKAVNNQGIIEYTVTTRDQKAFSSYNTISTPKSGQYRVGLPDGSKVWLNGGSSIRFPLAYLTSERWVEVTGEVYFDVHANKSHPFRMVAKNTTVVALGTKFNVEAYEDKKLTKTTLLEGTIKVASSKAQTILNEAGQIAVINENDDIEIKTVRDTNHVVAWTAGNFRFVDMHLTEIMDQVKRWYAVDVQYLKDTPSVFVTYSSFRRNTPIDTAIQTICDYDSRLKITRKGKTLIVSSK